MQIVVLCICGDNRVILRRVDEVVKVQTEAVEHGNIERAPVVKKAQVDELVVNTEPVNGGVSGEVRRNFRRRCLCLGTPLMLPMPGRAAGAAAGAVPVNGQASCLSPVIAIQYLC